MGRPPASCRSARPRTNRDAPRCTWSSPRWAVELRREESRCGLRDLVGPPELPVLALQLRDALAVRGAGAGPLNHDPPPPGGSTCGAIAAGPELARDACEGAEPLLA